MVILPFTLTRPRPSAPDGAAPPAMPDTIAVTPEKLRLSELPPAPMIKPAGASASADRVGALRRFAAAITVLNLLGHFWLGFEQSWAQMVVVVAVAYAVEIILETVEAWAKGRPAAYRGGGLVGLMDFLLPAHITGMAIAMLMFPGDRLLPFAFAAAVAIGSKALFRAPVNGSAPRHFLNPSNTGIATTLILFPAVGIAPPYHFTENIGSVGDALLPAVIVLSGTFLNARFTQRIPLIVGWVGGFAIQAILRALIEGTPIVAGLNPMVGMAFTLFTFYMISDPGTTPSSLKGQFVFGAGVAAAYAVLMLCHIVFGLFFALFAVCIVRGISLWVIEATRRQKEATAIEPLPLTHPGVTRVSANGQEEGVR